MTDNMTNMISIDDVLYQFSLEQEAPSAELLEEFTQRYPEYAEALTDFAIKWAADTMAIPDPIANESESTNDVSVSIAMSRFLNKTHELKSLKDTKTSSQASIVRNPFSALEKDEFRNLVQRLNVTRLFLSKIRDRIIEVSTVRPGFFDLLAKESGESFEIIKAHFAADAELHPDMKFKAKSKPSVKSKQSYEEALDTSGLSSDQKSILRNI
ncbi:hypothetical protein MNBD_GAMMA12-1806 [hydrothermal vent metagenome]|uniref:Uncharacterized protein n=1 Tax=hydrothermal vent metagenome TaxID=652676 RepID=A0A3B0Y967_9ZZZZ